MIDSAAFDARYAPSWDIISRLARKATGNFCCLCLLTEAAEVHHVHYQDQYGAVAGREWPGVDVFPLCDPCHTRAHLKDVWIRDRTNPVLGNHNTAEFIQVLKFGYQLLSESHEPRRTNA